MMRYLAIAAVLVQFAAAKEAPPENPAELRMLKAADAGDLKQVRKLLDSGLPVSALLTPDDVEGDPPHYQAINAAVDHGHVAVVRLLLDRGADVNARTSYGTTPIQEAGNLETARLLYSRGAKVIVDGDNGGGCINSAAANGDISMIRYFLSHGAKINAMEKTRGRRPLHSAVFATGPDGILGTYTYLLEHGADPSAKTEGGEFDHDIGQEPLHLLASRLTRDITEEVKAAELLIRHGASVTAVDAKGQQPLHVAQHKEMVSLLLANGAPVNTYDKERRQPIHRFVFFADEGMIATLLDHGADVDAPDGNGRTALEIAALLGQDHIIKVLLARGARPTQKAIKIAIESEGMDSSTARLLRSGKSRVGRIAGR
jgi:ankyrin repeat protein